MRSFPFLLTAAASAVLIISALPVSGDLQHTVIDGLILVSVVSVGPANYRRIRAVERRQARTEVDVAVMTGLVRDTQTDVRHVVQLEVRQLAALKTMNKGLAAADPDGTDPQPLARLHRIK